MMNMSEKRHRLQPSPIASVPLVQKSMLDTQDPQESECPSSTQGEGTILGCGKDVALGGCIPVSPSASALHDAGKKGEVGTCCFLLGTRIECMQLLIPLAVQVLE